jgi:hypothetical protein
METYIETGFTNPSDCHEACKDFQYFALQVGEECRCDNSFGTPATSYPRIADSECDKDGKGKYMGSNWANSVFIND